jgi:hypothetical protein
MGILKGRDESISLRFDRVRKKNLFYRFGDAVASKFKYRKRLESCQVEISQRARRHDNHSTNVALISIFCASRDLDIL